MPPKRVKLNHITFNVLNLDTISTLVNHLDLQTYGRLRCVNKQMDSVLAPFRPHILKRTPDRESIRVRLVSMNPKIEDIQVILDQLDIPSDLRSIQSINVLDPDRIKQFKFPAELIIEELCSRGRFVGDLSLELAMQGFCSAVVECAAKQAKMSFRQPPKFLFSKWNTTDKINVSEVRNLMRYHDIRTAVEHCPFVDLIYNQPGFELLTLCPAWQDPIAFVRHCRLKYTENDIKPFGWITSDLVDAVWELRRDGVWEFRKDAKYNF